MDGRAMYGRTVAGQRPADQSAGCLGNSWPFFSFSFFSHAYTRESDASSVIEISPRQGQRRLWLQVQDMQPCGPRSQFSGQKAVSGQISTGTIFRGP